jgi:hypothetical protein
MKDENFPSKHLLTDKQASSANPNLPAFLARPDGAPVYHGFPLVEETRTRGWCFGAITEFENLEGCEYGDGFVIAPDGSRAGIVWEVGEQEIQEVLPPDAERWGVYGVWFPRVVRTIDDLIFNFRYVLPALEKKYEEVRGRHGG